MNPENLILPVVAIVGRPNVGKSTLFNRMVGQRQALVHDRPGVTRDRHYGEAVFGDRTVQVIDTGGFEPDLKLLEEGDLFRQVRQQAEAAMAEADAILFVVDRHAGCTPADEHTAELLRRSLASGQRQGRKSVPVLLVVNKCDGPRHEIDSGEFWSLGFGEMHTISAEHGRGMWELWEAIIGNLPEGAGQSQDDDEDESPEGWAEEIEGEDPIIENHDGEIRIAVIGRPNIGKSTLVNLISGTDRHVVHDAPGTTMDAIDTVFQARGRTWRLVDTAGVRRKSRIDDAVEGYAVSRAIKTIERCHVTLLMIDGSTGVSTQDARLASLVEDRGRACIVLLNKWDKVRRDPERNVGVVDDELDQALPHLVWAPRLYISALTAKGCHRILPLVEQVYGCFNTRIPTSPLNRFLEAAVEAHSVPQKHNRPVRLNYMTQARVRPPTFIVWSNSPEGVKVGYRRYLENRLRQTYDFRGTPIRLKVRRKRKPGEAKEAT